MEGYAKKGGGGFTRSRKGRKGKGINFVTSRSPLFFRSALRRFKALLVGVLFSSFALQVDHLLR